MTSARYFVVNLSPFKVKGKKSLDKKLTAMT